MKMIYLSKKYLPAVICSAFMLISLAAQSQIITIKNERTGEVRYETFDRRPDLNAFETVMGDSITIEIESETGPLDKSKLSFLGVPKVWIARFAGDLMYYCSPNVNPGEFKPWLGFDSFVHVLAVRKYPAGFNPKEAPLTEWRDAEGHYHYRWGFLIERQMAGYATPYRHLYSWPKFKDVNGVSQRNSQREGLNMMFLHTWAGPQYDESLTVDVKNIPYHIAYANGNVKYIMGFDDDELLLLNHPDYRVNAGEAATTLQLKELEWKKMREGKTCDDTNGNGYPDKGCPVNDMVTAYVKNKSLDANIPGYEGYEIQDIGTNATNWAGTGNGNNAAPPIISLKYDDKIFDLHINAKPPFEYYKGFYSQIEGTSWPAYREEEVPYTLIGLDPTLIDHYGMEYAVEDKIGNVTTVTRMLKDLKVTEYDGRSHSWTTKFNITPGAYSSVTAYYYPNPNNKNSRVIVAGKELTVIFAMFAGVEELNDKQFVEGRGQGSKIWQEDYRDNPYDEFQQVRKFGNKNRYTDQHTRTYVFEQGDKVKWVAFDGDPHKFVENGTDWYQSSRTLARRIPDALLSDPSDPQLTFSLGPVDGGLDIDNLNREGKYWTHTFNETGTFTLRVAYRNTSEVRHKIIVVKKRSNAEDPIGEIVVRPLTPKEKAVLGLPETTIYHVAEVQNLLSNFAYSEGKRTNEIVNRWAPYYDFDASFTWTGFAESGDIAQFLEGYENKTKIYFDSWANHFSSNWLNQAINPSGLPAYIAPDRVTQIFKHADLRPFYDAISASLFSKPLSSGSWQATVPLASWTDRYGFRMRTNPSSIYDIHNLFDMNTGAFSGNPNLPPHPEAILAPDVSDDVKDKHRWYFDLITKRKIILHDIPKTGAAYARRKSGDVPFSKLIANFNIDDLEKKYELKRGFYTIKLKKSECFEGTEWKEKWPDNRTGKWTYHSKRVKVRDSDDPMQQFFIDPMGLDSKGRVQYVMCLKSDFEQNNKYKLINKEFGYNEYLDHFKAGFLPAVHGNPFIFHEMEDGYHKFIRAYGYTEAYESGSTLNFYGTDKTLYYSFSGDGRQNLGSFESWGKIYSCDQPVALNEFIAVEEVPRLPDGTYRISTANAPNSHVTSVRETKNGRRTLIMAGGGETVWNVNYVDINTYKIEDDGFELNTPGDNRTADARLAEYNSESAAWFLVCMADHPDEYQIKSYRYGKCLKYISESKGPKCVSCNTTDRAQRWKFEVVDLVIPRGKREIDEGEIAHYPFNRDGNNVLSDTLHGTVHGALLTTGRFGRPAEAFYFDGVDDYIETEKFPALGGAFSIALWVNPDAADGRREIISGGSTAAREGFYLYTNTAPKADLSTVFGPSGSTNLPINAWSHLVYTSDGTQLKLYVNGVLVSQKNAVANIAAGTVLIGKAPFTDSSFKPWKGKMDDVRVFDYALSLDEIGVLSGDKFIAHYPLDGNMVDISGNGLHGTWAASATTDRFNTSNASALFNGSTELSSATLPSLDSVFTISCWAMFNNSNQKEVLFELKNINLSNNLKVFRNGTAIGFEGSVPVPGGGASGVTLASGLTQGLLKNNTWHYISIVSNGTTTSLFVDGEPAGDLEMAHNFTQATIRVGSGWFPLIDRLRGKVDEFTVYKGVVEPSEIHSRAAHKPESIVAQYLFAGDAKDASGNNLHGNASDVLYTTDRFGVPNAAAQFNGLSSVMAVSSFPALDSIYSISAWVRTENSPVNRSEIVSFGSGELASGFFLYANATTFKTDISSIGGPSGIETSHKLSRWRHVAVVSEGRTTKLYLDGILQSSQKLDPNLKSGNLYIGKFLLSNAHYFKGLIDDVTIYRTPLTVEEITTLSGDRIVPNPIATYFVSDTGNANWVSDGTGNGNDAEWNGFSQYAADRFGNQSSAGSFTGDSYAEVKSFPAIGKKFTISAWVYRSDAGKDENGRTEIIGVGSTATNKGLHLHHALSPYKFQGDLSNFGGPSAASNATFGWTHIAFVSDGATLKLYKDGILANSVTKTDADIAEGTLRIGAAAYVENANKWRGRIDDLLIYNEALDQYDILALANDKPSTASARSAMPDAAASAAETLLDNAVRVFPNPANTELTIQYPDDKGTHILIRDILGRVYFQKLLPNSGNAGMMTIPVSNYPPGVYLVEVASGATKTIKRIIIQ